MTWGIDRQEDGADDREGYRLGSGIVPDRQAADGCTECKGAGYLICLHDHLVVHKQRNTFSGEERIVGQSYETCFGHLCRHCQPIGLLIEEKMRA